MNIRVTVGTIPGALVDPLLYKQVRSTYPTALAPLTRAWNGIYEEVCVSHMCISLTNLTNVGHKTTHFSQACPWVFMQESKSDVKGGTTPAF